MTSADWAFFSVGMALGTSFGALLAYGLGWLVGFRKAEKIYRS